MKPDDIKEKESQESLPFSPPHGAALVPIRSVNDRGTITVRYPSMGSIFQMRKEVVLEDEEAGIIERAFMTVDGHLGATEAY